MNIQHARVSKKPDIRQYGNKIKKDARNIWVMPISSPGKNIKFLRFLMIAI